MTRTQKKNALRKIEVGATASALHNLKGVSMDYSFSLSMGSGSIGYCVQELNSVSEGCKITEMNTWSFSSGINPKNGSSNASIRSQIKRRRINTRRSKILLKNLHKFFKNNGINIKNLKGKNPHEIGKRAVSEKITKNELGRYLHRVAKNRGFDATDAFGGIDKDLRKELEGFAYKLEESGLFVSEYKYQLMMNQQNTRGRKNEQMVVHRKFIVEELKQIRSLHEDYFDWDELEDILFFRRPLKPQQIGACSIYPEEVRCPKRSAYFQEFNLLQFLHNLRIYIDGEENPLSKEQFNLLKEKLKVTKKVNIPKFLKLPENAHLSKMPQQYNRVTYILNKHFGPGFLRESLEQQQLELEEYLKDPDVNPLELGSEGYCQYSEKALKEFILNMETGIAPQVIARQYIKEKPLLDILPNYSDLLPEKRIANPMLHKVLNKSRKLVNYLIKKYGSPKIIFIENVGELRRSKKAREDLHMKQLKQKKLNDERENWLKKYNIPVTPYNMKKMKLFDELDEGLLIAEGTNINRMELFSTPIELRHIIPFRKSLDHSMSNLTLGVKNDDGLEDIYTILKAFPEKYNEILKRAEYLPAHKYNRFLDMEVDFIDRQLSDLAYFSKATQEYLSYICKDVRGIKHGIVRIIKKAIIPHKDFEDFKKPAVNAALLGLSDRKIVNKITKSCKNNKIPKIEAWEKFEKELDHHLSLIKIPVYTVDRSINKCLHEETFYKNAENRFPEGHSLHGCNVVRRKSIESLTTNELKKIVDDKIRNDVANMSKKSQFITYFKENNIKKIQLAKKDQPIVKLTKRSSYNPNKKTTQCVVASGTAYLNIWFWGDSKFECQCLTYYEANKLRTDTDFNKNRPHPTAKLIKKLFKGDVVKIKKNDEIIEGRVKSISPINGTIRLAYPGLNDFNFTFNTFLKSMFEASK